jgi:hypothetical protein
MENQSLHQAIDVLSQALKTIADDKQAKFDRTFLDFHAEKGSNNYGKGIIFSGDGYTKQLVFVSGPDRFFSSENVDLNKDRFYSINNVKVLDDKELGSSIVKSNLKEVGRLKGLIVDGNVSIDQYVFYRAASNRLGIGTEDPNAGLSVAEAGVEVMLGTSESGRGKVGTHASIDFDIVTDDVTRISIKGNGDIDLGNSTTNSARVKINGKLSIGVNTIDPSVDLHVAGPVKIHNKLHMSAEQAPQGGNHNLGDICWNSNPRPGGTVGWVCTRAGNPGVWNPFGEIK